MRRRSFLAATAMGATVGFSGCLEGEVVMDVTESETIPAHRGWVKEIDEVDGSGEVGYTVRSEHDRFEVFYFRDDDEFATYEEVTFGNSEIPDNPSLGYDSLRAIAVENQERGVYEAKMPSDGSRYSLDIEGSHYFVVDNSKYGEVAVEDQTADLPVVISLEVVQDRF